MSETYEPGDRVLVRLGSEREHEAEVIVDRKDRVRVLLDGDRATVLKSRVRRVPERVVPRRVTPMMLPPRPIETATERGFDVAAATALALRAVPKPPKPWRSRLYLAYVRMDTCCVGPDGEPGNPCSGPIVAHHHGPRGTSQKADDSRTVPLCDGHHREFHDKGTIHGWDRAMLDRFFARTQARLIADFCTSEGVDVPEIIITALTDALRGR